MMFAWKRPKNKNEKEAGNGPFIFKKDKKYDL